MITRETVTAAMQQKGYKVFEEGNYNLNLVGLRTVPGAANKFDDWFCSFYKINNRWQFHCWEVTTDPGLYWLKSPMNLNGTAIIQPGNYKGCWVIGKHKGYEALVQAGSPFKIWRDRDKDGQPNYSGRTYTDGQGLNCHHAGENSLSVEKWSAGCQVFKRLADWHQHLAICKQQVAAGHGNKFTYTLLEWPKA